MLSSYAEIAETVTDFIKIIFFFLVYRIVFVHKNSLSPVSVKVLCLFLERQPFYINILLPFASDPMQ